MSNWPKGGRESYPSQYSFGDILKSDSAEAPAVVTSSAAVKVCRPEHEIFGNLVVRIHCVFLL